MREIADSVSADRAALLRAVEGLDPEQIDFKPEPDAWSIGDILHHLALTAEASVRLMAIMVEKVQASPPPRDASPDASVLATIDALVAGADERKARAPDRVLPRSHLPADEALERLEAARARLHEQVETLSEYDLGGLGYPHPMFGELNVYQWLLIGAWHERRHTRQIERIKANAGFPRRSVTPG